MKRKKLLLCLLAVILAMAVTCPAFAGTTAVDENDSIVTLALVDSGGTLAPDIVAGLTSDTQAESPARLQATVESPATIPQACNDCHQVLTAKAAINETGTQQQVITWTTQGDDGSSGGSSSHIGKDLASAPTTMTGSYVMPLVMISRVHHFGPAPTMIA